MTETTELLLPAPAVALGALLDRPAAGLGPDGHPVRDALPASPEVGEWPIDVTPALFRTATGILRSVAG